MRNGWDEQRLPKFGEGYLIKSTWLTELDSTNCFDWFNLTHLRLRWRLLRRCLQWAKPRFALPTVNTRWCGKGVHALTSADLNFSKSGLSHIVTSVPSIAAYLIAQSPGNFAFGRVNMSTLSPTDHFIFRIFSKISTGLAYSKQSYL